MIELGELEKHYDEFRKRDTQVIAISVEDRNKAEQTQRDFPHLRIGCDPGFDLVRAWGLLHQHVAPDGSDAAAPTTVFVDSKGIVRWLYRPGRHILRLSPKQVLNAVDRYLLGTEASHAATLQDAQRAS